MPEEADLEISCQQVLLGDASVFSIQWLDLPARLAPRLSAPLLLERYFQAVQRCTFHLVRPTVSATGVQFRLRATSLVLLSFSAPRLEAVAGGEAVHLHICGGLLVQPGKRDRGVFSLLMAPGEASLRVTVRLSDYWPLLLGSARPSWPRKLLYRITQAYIHKSLTVRYLSCLHREFFGSTLRARVKQVLVREGSAT